MTLRRRIAGTAGLAVAVAVLVLAVAVYVAVRAELRGEVDDALRQRALPAATGGEGRPGPPLGALDGERRGRPDRGPLRYGGAAGFVQLLTPGGVARRPPGQSGALPVSGNDRAIARSGEGEALRDVHVAGTHLRVLTLGVGPAGAVQVARPLDEIDRVLHRVLVILIVMGLAGVALAAALGGAVARSALSPIRRFTGRTEAIADDRDASRRLQVEGDDELGRLAASFNTTLDALARSVEAQRQLVADASHELRTPIASLRANIQVLQDAHRLPEDERESLRGDIVEELDELTALVADVVELARGSRPGEALDDVRLDLVVTAQAERAQRRAGDSVAFAVVVGEPVLVSGEPERISRAVSNLLDNARRWSPAGGVVEIVLEDGTLSVRDHGPGFEEGDLPHIFERFFRSDRARAMPGSGLGLAIVRQAAEAHGGWAQAVNPPDGGALVRVRFGPTRPVPSYDPPTPARRGA